MDKKSMDEKSLFWTRLGVIISIIGNYKVIVGIFVILLGLGVSSINRDKDSTTETLSGSDYQPIDPDNDRPINPGDVETANPDVSSDTMTLKITINPNIQLHDNFYYEYPDPLDPSRNYIVDFGRGISGTFSYSRALTQEERANWGHGGKLYDENGNEVGEEGNRPTFWSDPDGRFAVEFPENFPAGHYIYEIDHVISNCLISDRIAFDNV